jgi:hypothetical protein
MAANEPSLLATNTELPTACTSSGKLTGPIREVQACLATTEPLTGCKAAGWGLLGALKYDIIEQPDKSKTVAIKTVAARAYEIRAVGLNDG